MLTHPRETVYAYPTAERFGPACSGELDELSLVARGPTALYVHVPFCVALCTFCGFVKSSKFNARTLERYQELVATEIALVRRHVRACPPLSAIYFGGGTASVLTLQQVERILDACHGSFEVAPDAELSFEGECRTLSRRGFLEGLSRLGFTRVSFGAQTADPGLRTAVNLKPTVAELADLAAWANRLFEDVTVDVIYGWPGQTVESAVRDVQTLCHAIAPTSIDAFAFEAADASPALLGALHLRGITPWTGHELAAFHHAVARALSASGYEPYSYTLFSRVPPTRPVTYASCFYGYDDGNVIGVGRGAQSFIDGHMWGFGGSLSDYEACVLGASIPADALGFYMPFEREAVSWPRRGWIDDETIRAVDGLAFGERLAHLASLGVADHAAGAWRVTAAGRSHVPALISALLPPRQRVLHERDMSERDIIEGASSA